MTASTAGEGQRQKANPGLTDFPNRVPSSIRMLCHVTAHLAQGTYKRWTQEAGQALRGEYQNVTLVGKEKFCPQLRRYSEEQQGQGQLQRKVEMPAQGLGLD